MLAGMEWAVAQGADVVNMSLGGEPSDGTDPLSRAVDELYRRHRHALRDRGRQPAGEGTVDAPGRRRRGADGRRGRRDDTMAYFSSRGPRLGDAAVKPDITAPGVGIVAARAAGTSLGDPGGRPLHGLEGTSMATPHVAGAAAILKQRHPDLGRRAPEGGDHRLRPCPFRGATAFDTGTGRVDAERAIAQTVVSSGSLDLGWFPYPQTSLSTSHKPLTYTNLGSAPVTLTLAVAGADGGEPPAGVTRLAVDADRPGKRHRGRSTSRSTRTGPGVGTFSGVITADAGGGQQVRTAFGFGLESEHYDVTVDVVPRTGTQRAVARRRRSRTP